MLANSDVIQNNMAPPATRNDTMSMPVSPCVIASLPSGAMSPQKAQAQNKQIWAMSGLLFVILNLLFSIIIWPYQAYQTYWTYKTNKANKTNRTNKGGSKSDYAECCFLYSSFITLHSYHTHGADNRW